MVKCGKGRENHKNNKNRDTHAQTGGHNVTPALAEYGIAKKFMEGRRVEKKIVSPAASPSPRELTALDVIKCVLGVIFFLLVCYYGGVQYGR